MRKGKDEEAEKLLSEAVDIERVSLPHNHLDKISSQNFFISLSLHLSQLLVFCFQLSCHGQRVSQILLTTHVLIMRY